MLIRRYACSDCLGRWDQQGFISGAVHVPSAPLFIQEKMESLMKWHDSVAQDLHPVERAAMLHVIFVGIPPFLEGNGRTSRLLLNLELMKAGFLPIIIKTENRLAYYNALDKAHTTDDYLDFIELIKTEVNHTFVLYLSVAG